MFRSISVPFVILILFQTAFAVPVSDSKTFVLTEKNIVPNSEVQNLEILNSHEDNCMIGEIEVGTRQPNDVLHHAMPYTIQNNRSSVVTIGLRYKLNDDRQTIHYAKAVNDNSYSQSVMCADPNNLGSSSFSFKVHVAASSTSKVIPVFGIRIPN